MPFVIGGLILSFLIMLLFGGTELDRGLLLLFAQLDGPALERAARWIGFLGDPIIMLPLAGAGAGLLAYRRRWSHVVLLAALVLVGYLLIIALGIWTAPIRPELDEQLLPGQRSAFPSAPAAGSALTLLAIAFLTTYRRPARAAALGFAAAGALLIGFARLVAGAEWPSDVIGGWALGLAWTLLLLRLAGHDLSEGIASPLPPSTKESGSAASEHQSEVIGRH